MTFGSYKFAKRSSNPFSWFGTGLTIMDRYIATQLLMPFLFGVGAFSSIGVAIGALFELVRKVTEAGLPLSLAAQIFLLKLPYFVVLSFPMSVLLATLMVYSRLSSDSELIALRSSGVSIYRLVCPALIISFLITGMTFFFNEEVVPRANYQATVLFEKALNQERPAFQERNIFYQEFRDVPQPDGQVIQMLARIFYAQQFDGQQMKGLTILDFSQEGLNQIVASESATWDVTTNTWNFYNGTIYLVAADGSYRNILKFEQQTLQLPRTPLDLASRGRDYIEMNISESLEYLKLVRQSGDEKKIRKLLIRIQQKYSLPFACVAFGLVGATLGTRPQRTSKATGFGISVVVIFAYYLMMSIGDALGLSGILSPFIAGWLPTIFGLVAGVLLLIRIAR